MAGKLAIATRLAKATGSSVDEAFRWVGKVGTKKADDAVTAVENGLTWKRSLIGAGAVGTGLAWNEQETRQAEALAERAGANADQSATSEEILKELIESEGELPADVRDKLLEQFAENYDGGGDDNDDENDDEGGFLADLFGDGGFPGGSVQQTVILLVVVLVVLNWALARTSTIGMPTVAGGAR